MLNILVFGLKDPVGGLEKVVYEYTKPLVNTHNIHFDFIIFGKNFSQTAQFSDLGNVLYVTPRKENFKQYKTELEKLFKEKHYDAVWGNYSGLTNIDLLVMAKKYNVPIRIAHSHSSGLRWGSAVMKYVVTALHHYNRIRIPGFATHYWGCSESACSFMFPGIVKNKFTVVKNAVDLSVFHPDSEKRTEIRKQLNISENVPVIGHVARMSKEKNQAFLLNVFAEILKISPDAVLLFIGDGDLKEELIKHTHTLGIEKNVIFTGHKNNVSDYLCAMDTFVLPSVSEALGLCAIEAQATGVPCTVSDIVPTEVDISGTTEFLSLDAPVEEWAKTVLSCCKKTISNPKKCITENNYEINIQAEKIFSVFAGE